MGEQTVRGVLREMVRKHSRLPITSISDQDTLAGNLGFDSLAFLMILSDLEARFRIRMPLENVDELRDLSFGGLARLVEGRLH